MRDMEERSNRRKKMWTMFVVNVLAVVCWLHFRNKYEKTEQTEPGQNKTAAAIDMGAVKVNTGKEKKDRVLSQKERQIRREWNFSTK